MIFKKDDYQDLFQKKKKFVIEFLIRSYLKKKKNFRIDSIQSYSKSYICSNS